MRSLLIFLSVLSLTKFHAFAGDTTSDDNCFTKVDQELRPKLSPQASIVHYSTSVPRWSEYSAPKTATLVNVADENDVVETVLYCIQNGLDFLAQTSAHGWATTFHLSEKDIIINMLGLNQISFNDAETEVTFGGGAIVSEVVEAAYQRQLQVVTANCNCIGMGAILGGGLSRLMGRYGLEIDNLLSVNLVTATGELITVNPSSSPDLWWAIRGAGANFGIVTSATMKAYPTVNNGMAWKGNLIFTEDKLEALTQTISDLDFQKEMSIHFLFVAPAPDYIPTIITTVWYSGTEVEGKVAFKPLYDLGPVNDTTQELPYNQINAGDDGFCTKGGRKPTYTAGLKKMDPTAFREIWNEYTSLIAGNPDFKLTSMLVECYSYKTVRTFPDNSSAFPHRDVNFEALIIPWYYDASLDPIATSFGEKVRALWEESSGFDTFRAYINFAHGDESLSAIYGESLPRLESIKQQWDPNGRFSQFFPLPTQ